MSKASKFRTVCVYIIGTELMERLAYYSLAYNLVLFFTRELKISTDIADSITTLFSALVMVFALLGGYVSDVYLGRYRTILWFSSLYLVAIGCCAVAAAPPVRSAPFALVSLFFIAMAAGGIKPNVSTLGADQYDVSDPAQALEKASFFNTFYFAINIGAAFAVGFSYVSQNGLGTVVPRAWGFSVSWAVPAVGFGVAILVFVARSGRYVKVPPSGSATARLIAVVTRAGRGTGGGGGGGGVPAARWLVRCILAALPGVLLLMGSLAAGSAGSTERVGFSMVGTLGVLVCLGAMAGLSVPTADALLRRVEAGGADYDDAVVAAARAESGGGGGGGGDDEGEREAAVGEHSAGLRGTLLAASLLHSDHYNATTEGDIRDSGPLNQEWGVVRAAAGSGGGGGGGGGSDTAASTRRDTLDAVAVLRLLPFLSLISFYWTLYSAMAPTFVNQGCQMDLRLGGGEIPVVALGLVNTVGILVLIPLFDRVVFPALRRRGWAVTMLQKIGVGFLLACAAMLCAAAVEGARMRAFARGELAGLSPCYEGEGKQQMVALSVLWQVPQYFLIGASEVFASVTSLEFFFSESPPRVKSVLQAANLCAIGLGGFIGAGVIQLVNMDAEDAWIADDANHGHLDKYFLLLAALVLPPFAEFLRRASAYEYTSTAQQQAGGGGGPPRVARPAGRAGNDSYAELGSVGAVMRGPDADIHML